MKPIYFFLANLKTFNAIQPIKPPIAPEMAQTKIPVTPKDDSIIFLNRINPPTAKIAKTICSEFDNLLDALFSSLDTTNTFRFELFKSAFARVATCKRSLK